MAGELDHAVQLLKSGQVDKAQKIIQNILRANPQDLQAWSWYVRSMQTTEKRIQALEYCLRFNPGNADVQRALDSLRAKLADANSDASMPPAVARTAAPSEAPSPVTGDQSTYALAGYDAYAASTLAQEQDAPSYGTYGTSSAVDVKDIDAQALAYEVDRRKNRVAAKPMAWFEVWLSALTQPNVQAYEQMLADPNANTTRASTWLLISGSVAGLLAVVFNPAFQSLPETLGAAGVSEFDPTTFMIVMILCVVPLSGLASTLGTMLGALLLNWVAKLLGGLGTFTRQFYAIAAYTAPLTLVSAGLTVVPILGCLGALLGLYAIWLNVVAIRAAQEMETGRAIAVVVLLDVVFFCLVGIVYLSALSALLPALGNLPQ
jgi:hypothetical protein